MNPHRWKMMKASTSLASKPPLAEVTPYVNWLTISWKHRSLAGCNIKIRPFTQQHLGPTMVFIPQATGTQTPPAIQTTFNQFLKKIGLMIVVHLSCGSRILCWPWPCHGSLSPMRQRRRVGGRWHRKVPAGMRCAAICPATQHEFEHFLLRL